MRLGLLLSLFMFSHSALAKKAPSELAGLVAESSSIVAGRVQQIEIVGSHRFAIVKVTETLKGDHSGSITLYATRTWTCDTTWLELGEEVVVFIRPAGQELHEALRDLRKTAAVEPLYVVMGSGAGLLRSTDGRMASVDGSLVRPASWHLVPGPPLLLPNGKTFPGKEQVTLKQAVVSIRKCVNDNDKCN